MAVLRRATSVGAYHVPMRVIYDYEMIFMVDGVLNVIEDGKEYRLEKNDLHIMPPYIEHRHYIKNGEFCYYHNLHFDFLYDSANPEIDIINDYGRFCNKGLEHAVTNQRLMSRRAPCLEGFENARKLNIANSLRLVNILFNIEKLYAAEGFGLKAKSKFIEAVDEIKTNIEGNADSLSQSRALVADFIDGALSKYDSVINISDFAADNCVSENYFRRIFKENTAKSPHQYVIDVRIDHAKELLLSRKYSIKQVSVIVGYPDTHYFSRLFKKKTGYAPIEYIQKSNSNQEGL
jgi:AraC-like DNA-binding protein